MREYRFAVATAVAAFSLIVIGGLVHPTGSSLACPDWPLCNGQALPPLRGGILFEQGHRLAALALAVMTAVLAGQVVRGRDDRGVRRLSVAAVVVVAAQAAVGAIAVLFELPLLASTGHLALSMAFFSLVLVLAYRLRPDARTPVPVGPRSLVAVAAIAAYASIVLGAFVRHTGSALACDGSILCGGALWPADGAARIQMVHRLWNWALAVVVLAAAIRVLRRRDLPGPARALAGAAPLLLGIQGLLGILTVTSAVSVPVVSLHLAMGALVLGDLVALFLVLEPRGETGAAPGRLHPAGA
jgi:heme A synthase